MKIILLCMAFLTSFHSHASFLEEAEQRPSPSLAYISRMNPHQVPLITQLTVREVTGHLRLDDDRLDQIYSPSLLKKAEDAFINSWTRGLLTFQGHRVITSEGITFFSSVSLPSTGYIKENNYMYNLSWLGKLVINPQRDRTQVTYYNGKGDITENYFLVELVRDPTLFSHEMMNLNWFGETYFSRVF